MRWQLKYIGTLDTGEITSIADVNQYGDFSTDRTVGDEFTVRVSDILIKHLQELPFDENADNHWLALQFKGELVDVYRARFDFENRDDKSGRFDTRLYSITKKFFDDAKVNVVEYDSGDSEKWNPTGAGYLVDINEGGIIRTDRWAFGLGDILNNIAGSNSNGYRLTGVTHVVPVYGDGEVPLLHRGSGFTDTIYTEDNAFNLTFQSLDVRWYSMFMLASVLFNSVFFVKPAISDISGTDYLTVALQMTKRSWATPPSTLETVWLERKLIREKYRIDGVSISGADSYLFTEGNVDSENIQEHNIGIFKGSDPQSDDDASEDIEISEANPDGFPITEYMILDGSNENQDWFANVGLNYISSINSGNGIEGRIIYNGADLLDELYIGLADSVKLFNIRLTKNSKIAQIEGLTGD